MTLEEMRSSWNKIAKEYQIKHDRPIDDVCYGRLAPRESTLRLLGKVASKRILDLGCGGGQNCIALTKMGAECVGVDRSEEQLCWAAIAAEQEGVAVELHCAELLEFLSSVSDKSFDIVISVFCLPYVQDLTHLYHQVYRILKPSGVLLFSTNHPLREIAHTDNGTVVIRKSYLESDQELWDWKGTDNVPVAPLVSYRRTFSELLNPLIGAGFVIDRLVEPEPITDDPLFEEDIELFSHVPSTLICKAHVVKDGA